MSYITSLNLAVTVEDKNNNCYSRFAEKGKLQIFGGYIYQQDHSEEQVEDTQENENILQ